MKEKILPFIIGVLVGAIIATGGFYLYSKSHDKGMRGMPDGNPPAMMQQDGNSTDGNGTNRGTPPDLPSGENGNQGFKGNGGPQGGPGQNNNSNGNNSSNQNSKVNSDNSNNT